MQQIHEKMRRLILSVAQRGWRSGGNIGKDMLVVVPNNIWDGTLLHSHHTTHYLADAFSRIGQRVMVVNLVDLGHIRKWPKSAMRFVPGLWEVSDTLSVLNIYGVSWRSAVGRGESPPTGTVAGFIRRAAAVYPVNRIHLLVGDPVHGRLLRQCNEVTSIYYAVDDYAAGDPLNRAMLLREEESTLQRATTVLAVSEPLAAKLRMGNALVEVLPNAANVTELRELAKSGTTPNGLVNMPHPWVAYVGGINERCDVPQILRAVESHGDKTFVFAGGMERVLPEDEAAARALARRSNVVILGRCDRSTVAAVLSRSQIGWIPYRHNAFNESCCPFKTYEYACFGLPIVATSLPALEGTPALVVSANALAAGIAEGLQNPEWAKRSRVFGETQDWKQRARWLTAKFS